MELLGLVTLPVWFVLLVVIAVLVYLYGTAPYSVWKKLGIPGPTPNPFIGNYDVIKRLGLAEAYSQWRDRYGSVVGVYHMRRPMLLVTDTDMLKAILVSDFNSFTHKGVYPKWFQPLMEKSVNVVDGPPWKPLRNGLTPAFRATKLREKETLVRKAADKAVDLMLEAATNHDKVDAYEFYSTFTMDVILSSLFSLDPRTNGATCRWMLKVVEDFSQISPFRTKMIFLAGMFPFLSRLLGKLSEDTKTVNEYTHFVREMMKGREDPKAHKDFLQNFIDLELTDVPGGESKLSMYDIVCQTFTFFVAGTETTALLLMFLSYVLATHQDIQQRLYEEVKYELGDGEIDYTNIQNLKFMDACIRETLRLYPVTVRYTRECNQTTTVNGVTIPAGAGIIVPVKLVSGDPKNYPDPEKFNPNRFIKGHPDEITNVPFLAFGIGPRNCIGMRLALVEVTMLMAAMLRKIKFVGSNAFTIKKAVVISTTETAEPIRLEVAAR